MKVLLTQTSDHVQKQGSVTFHKNGAFSWHFHVGLVVCVGSFLVIKADGHKYWLDTKENFHKSLAPLRVIFVSSGFNGLKSPQS